MLPRPPHHCATEAQIREALDGRFVAFHFSGQRIDMRVPVDFDPYSPEEQAIIKRAWAQKVIEK